MKQVNLMHILLLGPTMIYAGSLTQKQLKTKDISIDLLFGAIVVYALFIPFIVRNKFLKKKKNGTKEIGLIFSTIYYFLDCFYI